MAICNGYKIRQVNMASIINTIDGVLLDYTAISYIFSEWYLFSLYYFLINDKYIIIGGYYHVSIANIRFVTLTMILPNGISKLTFAETLHIPTLETNLISLGILHHKGTLVQS